MKTRWLFVSVALLGLIAGAVYLASDSSPVSTVSVALLKADRPPVETVKAVKPLPGVERFILDHLGEPGSYQLIQAWLPEVSPFNGTARIFNPAGAMVWTQQIQRVQYRARNRLGAMEVFDMGFTIDRGAVLQGWRTGQEWIPTGIADTPERRAASAKAEAARIAEQEKAARKAKEQRDTKEQRYPVMLAMLHLAGCGNPHPVYDKRRTTKELAQAKEDYKAKTGRDFVLTPEESKTVEAAYHEEVFKALWSQKLHDNRNTPIARPVSPEQKQRDVKNVANAKAEYKEGMGTDFTLTPEDRKKLDSLDE